jgi:hypothetical protein
METMQGLRLHLKAGAMNRVEIRDYLVRLRERTLAEIRSSVAALHQTTSITRGDILQNTSHMNGETHALALCHVALSTVYCTN